MKLLWSFLVGAALLSASPVGTTVELISPGDPTNIIHNNIYISPYEMQINGHDYAALCIDYLDESYLNDPWQANITPLSSLNFSNTYHHADANVAQEYEEEAWLYSQITVPGISNQTRTDIQKAVWLITDSSYNPSDAQASYWVGQAESNYGSINLNDFEIVSDVNTGNGRNQEFMVCTPEPGTLMLLGTGLLLAGFGAARKRFFANRATAMREESIV